jgi:iron complex transport system ATP-binding protein
MLEIQSLCVAYGQKLVLEDISLSVSRGEILAVICPNGVGKSTLIRVISGILSPCSGRVLLDGNDLRRLSPMQRARYMAVVPQARELPGAYSIYETVMMGRTPYLNWLGRAGKEDHTQVNLALERTQTLSLAERRVGELSGGEQQRVLLARALAQNAPVLLLDEPTTHLDLEHQSVFLNLVRKLADEKKLAVLLVLHDLNLAGLYADRVALLVDGRLSANGTPDEVLTSENLSKVYHVSVNVIRHPDYGTPLILPDGKEGVGSQAAGVPH